ncbi:hypothetical protein [Streptomyces sp. x-19]|uniref:hypothetical protein n=1 Tax=Streptomyces sp. x-19 TaxID=2789280 RepID=UPI00397F7CDE
MLSFCVMRRSRRLRHLRRLADRTTVVTRLYLPGHHPAAARHRVEPTPGPAPRARLHEGGPDGDERNVQALLQILIDGRPTALPREARDG